MLLLLPGIATRRQIVVVVVASFIFCLSTRTAVHGDTSIRRNRRLQSSSTSLVFKLGLIPDEVLESIPKRCRGKDTRQLEQAVFCAEDEKKCDVIDDLIAAVEDFPNEKKANKDIQTCDHYNTAYCTTIGKTTNCAKCSKEFEALWTCFLIETNADENSSSSDEEEQYEDTIKTCAKQNDNDCATAAPTTTPSPTWSPTHSHPPTITGDPTYTPTITFAPSNTPNPTSPPSITPRPTITPQPTHRPTMTAAPTYFPTVTREPTYHPTVTREPTYHPTVSNIPTISSFPTYRRTFFVFVLGCRLCVFGTKISLLLSFFLSLCVCVFFSHIIVHIDITSTNIYLYIYITATMSPYPTYHPTTTNPPTYNPTTSQSPTYGRTLFVCCSYLYSNVCLLICLLVCWFPSLTHHINYYYYNYFYNSNHNVSTHVGLTRHTQTDQ